MTAHDRDASNLSLILDVNNTRGDDTFLMFAEPSLTNDVGFPQYDERHYWAPDLL